MLPLIKHMKSGLEVLELLSASESPAGFLNRLLGPNRRVSDSLGLGTREYAYLTSSQGTLLRRVPETVGELVI